MTRAKIHGCGLLVGGLRTGTHDNAIFGMGCRVYRLAGLESLGRRRNDA